MRSRGQYGEENNQAGLFETEGNKSLIPGRLARSPPSLYSKSAKRKLCVCAKQTLASIVPVQVVSGGHRNYFIDFFPPAFVNSQIAQVNRPKILEQMVSTSSPLCSEVFVISPFLFQIEDLENSKSFRCEIMKKQPHMYTINTRARAFIS